MRRNRVLRYFILMAAVFFTLLVINIFIFLLISILNDTVQFPQGANAIKNNIEISETGEISLNEKSRDELISKNEFAMIISNDGHVIWSINKPDEVPDEYKISEVAAFSHWYLKDYPVYTTVLDDGILVVGMPKGSLWRYNLTFEMSELSSLFKVFPFVIIADIFITIAVPLFILKRQEKQNEKERVQWISGVSHDIRTPLSLILGNAQDIIDDGNSGEIQVKAKSIKKQTLKIRELVANLNTDNIIGFGCSKTDTEINLPRLIRDTVCSVMEQDEEGIFDVDFEVDDSLENMCINADEGLVKRLITNLILNSMTHNSDGCGIKIMLKKDDGFKYFLHKNRCRLIIKDNGKGADSDTVKKLNGLYNDVNLTEHGLGIAVVKKIAALYHWSVFFSSDNGFMSEIIIR